MLRHARGRWHRTDCRWRAIVSASAGIDGLVQSRDKSTTARGFWATQERRRDRIIRLPGAKYKSIEATAKGRPGKIYYVAEMMASDVRDKGITVEPRPIDGDPGHAELPQLNAGNRKDTQTLTLQGILADLCTGKVHGPFGP